MSDNNKTDNKKEMLSAALKAVNQYMTLDDSLCNRGEFSQKEFDNVKKGKRDCVKVLSGIDDALVQAIATTLMIDRHYSNAREMIRELADRGAA